MKCQYCDNNIPAIVNDCLLAGIQEIQLEHERGGRDDSIQATIASVISVPPGRVFKTILKMLPGQGSNLDFSDPESDVLPITPPGIMKIRIK